MQQERDKMKIKKKLDSLWLKILVLHLEKQEYTITDSCNII